jgi:beta-glucosidase
MGIGGRRVVLAAAVAALSSVAVGGVIAGTGASDDAALRPARGAPDKGIERRVDALLEKMTLREKLAQLQLLPDNQVTDEDVRNGLGSVLSLTDPEKIAHFQRIAVEDSRLKIPLLFAYDTIHGFRTTFPIPLAQASSFDPDVTTTDATIAARETAAVGIKQAYSPMVDVSHEPRWGRIAEGSGEDPYLGQVLAAARVKALQGSDYSADDKVVASPKHLAAYGQPEGGRDYNTTDVSLSRLWNLYLPPFKAAIDAGADTLMCGFNAISGVPACANDYLMNDVVKGKWDFDGFIESDYTAVAELRACPPRNPDEGPCGHGVAADGKDAARIAFNAGVDSEMVSRNITQFGEELVREGKISRARIDDAVRRILRVKFRAGLFERPFADQSKIAERTMTPQDVAAARRTAARSMVLLKNEGNALPLSTDLSSIAVVGALANSKEDPLGPWKGIGEPDDVVTVVDGIKAAVPGATVTHAEGCDVPCESSAGFGAAVDAANAAQATVVVLGESADSSGEAAVRSQIDLPGRQEELLRAIKATGKPFVVVLMNGRPLTLRDVDAAAPAILESWFGGIQAGNAIADVLFGKVNPGGKLPVTFPHTVGQVPIYYNHEPTGRPCNTEEKWNARYLDLPCTPLYPFGYGLSYTTFEIGELELSSESMKASSSVLASVKVRNTGSRAGDEVVQLYLHDPVASLTQPVRRLRGFERVTLQPGESRTVTFRLDRSDVGFYDNAGSFRVEPGRIDVYAGSSSTAELTASFEVTP